MLHCELTPENSILYALGMHHALYRSEEEIQIFPKFGEGKKRIERKLKRDHWVTFFFFLANTQTLCQFYS